MNDTQSSLTSESSEFKDVARPQVESSSWPKSIGVYDRPERRGSLSPLVIGVVALLIVASVLAILFFQVLT